MSNSAIAVLGVPVYNRVDLLLRCLRSVDFPTELLVIVNNGGLSLPELHEQVWREVEMHSDIGDVQIFDPSPSRTGGIDPHLSPLPIQGEENTSRQSEAAPCSMLHAPCASNIGVAGAWNYLLHQHCDEHVLLCNNDIQWARGDLEKMHACVRLNHGMQAVFGNWSYSNFIITRAGRDALGYFDENFWPAYLEDGDHWRRIVLSGAKICHAVGVRSIHGEVRNSSAVVNKEHGDGDPSAPLHSAQDDKLVSSQLQYEGSCTIHSDPKLAEQNRFTHGKNWDYYVRKWGWGGDVQREVFRSPFNSPDYPLNGWFLSDERITGPHYFSSSEEPGFFETKEENAERRTPNIERRTSEGVVQ